MLTADLAVDAGFEVLQAANADEAIEILEIRLDIRVLFTDIDMPGSRDGLRLAAYVRDRWPPIDIIVVSGQVRPNSTEMPMRSLFFAKPYDEVSVKTALQNFSMLAG